MARKYEQLGEDGHWFDVTPTDEYDRLAAELARLDLAARQFLNAWSMDARLGQICNGYVRDAVRALNDLASKPSDGVKHG